MTLPAFLYRQPGDREVVQYLVDFWQLHPDEWARLNDVDNTQLYRGMIYDEVNAATDGDLERLIARTSLHWIYLFGLSITAMGKLEASS